MYLVLCDTTDRSAIWAARQLRERLSQPVKLVSPEMLFSSVWEHRVETSGAFSRIRVSEQLTIDSRGVSGILNRISVLPQTLFPYVSATDRTYAIQEMSALFTSWLHSLKCPVLNKPCMQGLCGPFHPPQQWIALAARNGVPASPGEPELHAMSIDGRWLGPPEFGEAARKLTAVAREEGAPLLGVGLRKSDGEWTLAAATPMPDLAAGGVEAADALASALAGES